MRTWSWCSTRPLVLRSDLPRRRRIELRTRRGLAGLLLRGTSARSVESSVWAWRALMMSSRRADFASGGPAAGAAPEVSRAGSSARAPAPRRPGRARYRTRARALGVGARRALAPLDEAPE